MGGGGAPSQRDRDDRSRGGADTRPGDMISALRWHRPMGWGEVRWHLPSHPRSRAGGKCRFRSSETDGPNKINSASTDCARIQLHVRVVAESVISGPGPGRFFGGGGNDIISYVVRAVSRRVSYLLFSVTVDQDVNG